MPILSLVEKKMDTLFRVYLLDLMLPCSEFEENLWYSRNFIRILDMSKNAEPIFFPSDFKLNNQHDCHHKSSWQYYQEKAHLKKLHLQELWFLFSIAIGLLLSKRDFQKAKWNVTKRASNLWYFGICNKVVWISSHFHHENDFYEFFLEYMFVVYFCIK